ncbi:hypothetical protein LSAT2_000148, partial [Lamellibrachia satsuma]
QTSAFLFHGKAKGYRTTDPAMLSSCKDACDQHIKRENYHIAIWRHCLEAPPVLSPHGIGCIVDRDMLVHWT